MAGHVTLGFLLNTCFFNTCKVRGLGLWSHRWHFAAISNQNIFSLVPHMMCETWGRFRLPLQLIADGFEGIFCFFWVIWKTHHFCFLFADPSCCVATESSPLPLPTVSWWWSAPMQPKLNRLIVQDYSLTKYSILFQKATGKYIVVLTRHCELWNHGPRFCRGRFDCCTIHLESAG